jgi:chlorite dismutase
MNENKTMHQFDNMPPVPLTIEGSSVLHQMLRLRWAAWRAVAASERAAILNEATTALGAMEKEGSAAFTLLGHKGDLMLVHFRPDFEGLLAAQTRVAHLRLWDYLEETTSYVSVVELGLYESSMKTYSSLAEKGIEPHTPEWNAEIAEALERSREAMKPRLYPEVPPAKFVCFYPMDRRRGEHKNWYQVPMAERQKQMHDHGMIGRRYAGSVKQIITGSIGFDDWDALR